MKNTRWIVGSLGLCGVLLLGGCAAPGAYGDYGYGGPSYGGGYARPYYDTVPAPVIIQGGGYYDSPGYYGRPGYYARPDYYDRRPAYGARPGYDGGRPGRSDGYRPGNPPVAQPSYGGARPGRAYPVPQQVAPAPRDNVQPYNPSMPIESQRILRERASGSAP